MARMVGPESPGTDRRDNTAARGTVARAMRRSLHLLLTAVSLSATLGACGGARATRNTAALSTPVPTPVAPFGVELLVVAPHPDDEVLMAFEHLRAERQQGHRVEVAVMTNGDLSCARNGLRREAETIDALALADVTEEHVHFLGYPDGYLDALGPAPLPAMERATAEGGCELATGTYAARGFGGVDVHRARTGVAGAYTDREAIEDLLSLLRAHRPRRVITAHGMDLHPDHAMTFVLLARAVAELGPNEPRPTIDRSVVHAGPCWPNGGGVRPCPAVPTSFALPEPAPLDGYEPTERWPSSDAGETKRHAIARFVSQLETPIAADDWLSTFGRMDEPLYRLSTLDIARPPLASNVMPATAPTQGAGPGVTTGAVVCGRTITVDALLADSRLSQLHADVPVGGGLRLLEGRRPVVAVPPRHGAPPSDISVVLRRGTANGFAEIDVFDHGILRASSVLTGGLCTP